MFSLNPLSCTLFGYMCPDAFPPTIYPLPEFWMIRFVAQSICTRLIYVKTILPTFWQPFRPCYMRSRVITRRVITRADCTRTHWVVAWDWPLRWRWDLLRGSGVTCSHGSSLDSTRSTWCTCHGSWSSSGWVAWEWQTRNTSIWNILFMAPIIKNW